ADVVASTEIRELDPGGGGDDEVAGVRVGKRGPGPFERIGLREHLDGAARLPAARRRGEAQLVAVLPRHHGPVLMEQNDVTSAVEALCELPRAFATAGQAI